MDEDDLFITQLDPVHIVGEILDKECAENVGHAESTNSNSSNDRESKRLGGGEECSSPILFSEPPAKRKQVKINSPKLKSNVSESDGANTISRHIKLLKNNLIRGELLTPQIQDGEENKIAVEAGMCVADFLRDVDSQFGCSTFYGLPLLVKQLLKKERGIEQLYDWQEKCLSMDAVTERRNLVYSLPTGGGKTLVAEILLWREVVAFERDAILILPYVAIVQEKVRLMEEFSLKLNFFLEEYAGRKGHFPPTRHRKKRTLYVATIEKANLLVDHFIESKTIQQLGLVVVDELHMLGDGSRGAVLEMILTKLKFAAENVMLVGMSATIGNIEDLAQFLNAKQYNGDFRPVELREYFKVNDGIYENKTGDKNRVEEEEFVLSRTFPMPKYYPDSNSRKMDPDGVGGLVLEVVPSASCLVFCSSKKNCENVAKLISRVASFSPTQHQQLKQHMKKEKEQLMEELKREGYVCPTLKQTIPCGIAYHHAGLTTEERSLIEEAFLQGTLSCLTCTSTLAAGVNLPAQRVIVREPRIGKIFITCSRLKQMVGRAGRAGLNECGESIVILKESDIPAIRKMLNAGTEPCLSHLAANGGRGLKVLLLNAISLQLAQTSAELFSFASQTLLCVQENVLLEDSSLTQLMSTALQQLVEENFVDVSSSGNYAVNVFGKATCKGGLDMEWALRLEKDLELNLQSLVLYNTCFHLLYLTTPYDQVEALAYLFDPIIFRQEYFSLAPDELQVVKVIGINEGIAINIGCGKSTKFNWFTIHRVYLTMILSRLWKMCPMWEVADIFNIPRGNLQNLLQTSCNFAQSILLFCQEYTTFSTFCDMLPGFIQRLYHCVEPQLLTLMELPAVKRSRASELFHAGYKDVASVAKAQPQELVQAVSHLSFNLATKIIHAAKNQMRKKLEELQEEIEEVASML